VKFGGYFTDLGLLGI